MKIEEVPQDGAYLIEGRIRDLCYVIDDKGHYTKVLSKGWAPKNEAIRLAWDIVYEKAELTRQKVLSGILSPIAFYMELNIMDINILSNYTGFPKRKVRRHLKMKGFNKLTKSQIFLYAEALNISAEELTNIDKLRELTIKHED
jgi:hypothetical protein